MIGAPLAGLLAAAGAGGPQIEYVGGATGATGGRTSTWTISLTSLTGGVASAPAAGDFVVVFYAVGTSNETSALALSVTGYTQQALLFSNDAYEANLLVATKLLTGADTSITLSQTYNAAYAGAATVHVFRNVNPTTPLDVAVQTVTQINTALANPPSITPATPGAWVVAGGGAGRQTGSATFTSSDLTAFLSAGQNDFRSVTAGAGYVADASSTVDPAQFGLTQADSANFAAAAVTLALRPAP